MRRLAAIGAFVPLALAAVAPAADLPDPALAADRGQMRTWFVPMSSEGGELGKYAIDVDSRGRIVAGNGDLSVYDGAVIERLPRPGGELTSALAIDRADRIWTGNSAELGYYATAADGAWVFHSIRRQLPAENAGYERIWSVHCLGDSVVFVASHQVMRWRQGRFEVWPLAAYRRPVARTEGTEVLILPWGVPAGEPSRVWAIGAETPLHEKPFDFSHGPTRPTMIARAGRDRWVLGGSGSDGSGFIFDDAGRFVRELPHPAWKLRPLDSVPTPAGWVFGGAGGLLSLRDDGRLRFALSARTSTVPAAITDVLAAGRDGRIWGVNAFGLVGIEPDARVTYFGAEQGIVEPIRSFTRVGQELWLTASRGLVIFGPSANPPATGRMTPGEDLPGLLNHSISAAQSVEVSPRFALVAGENLAVMSLADRQWTVALDGAAVYARSFCEPWRGDDVLLAATEREVYLLGIDIGRWPVRWQRAFPRIDRVLALPGRQALLADPGGRVWLLQWRHDADAWELAAEPQPLTPPPGLGPILRLDRREDEIWLYTSEAAWRWRPGQPAFTPLATDLPAGAVLAGVAATPDGRAWAVARITAFSREPATNPVHAVWRVRLGDGRIEGFREPPVEVVDRLGALTNAAFEPSAPGGQGAVWWLTGTYGMARVSLELANRPVEFLTSPCLEKIEDDHRRLPLAGGVTLASGSALEIQYGYPQSAHALPVAYQTRLAGLEADWSESTTVHRRRWERLPPGAYTVQVRAVDIAGQISREANWPVRIRPNFTETPWFLAAVLTFVGSGGWMAAWGWTRWLRRRAVQLERTVGERTAALDAANRELREKNDLGKELVGVLAHDLRTPLEVGALLASRAIARMAPGPARTDVEKLTADLAHLRQVLDGNVDLSRMELGLVPVVWRVRPWHEFVGEIEAAHAAAAAAKGLAWSLRPEGGAGRLALVDAANHRRIIDNLLSNAVKYTRAGRIDVAVRWSPETSPLVAAEWEIADEGPGLAAGVAATLDERYRRPELAGGPGAGRSSGLGLALAVRLVRLAGGTLAATPRPGGGTLFRVRLPLLDLGPVEATPDPLDFNPPFSRRALVVDDEARQRDHAAELLEPLGVQVDFAATCAEAETVLARVAPDLAFLDFSLPDGSGLELMRRMQAAGRRPRIVAIVTAHDSPALAAACRDAGCDAYLPKPLAVRDAIALLVRPS